MVESHKQEDNCCSACHKPMQKAHRVYLFRRYCNTCYARLFKPQLCPGCGNSARLPIFHSTAVCHSCITSVPCMRCERIGRPVGRLTPKGLACNSCAHYFTEPRHCEVCNALSTRLSKKRIDNQEMRCCPKCASNAETCPSCRRYRVLIDGRDGVRECRRCAQLGEIECQSCGELSPAGYGSECENCRDRRTFYKRLQMNVQALSRDVFREAYSAYGEWLINKIGPKRAALLINGHLKSFMEMNAQWLGLPTYQQLLEAKGALWIRRAQLPMQWMTEERGMHVDEMLKEDVTETRRIEAIVVSLSSETGQKLLQAYRVHLESKPNKRANSLRSVRMAMRSAANLVLVSEAAGRPMPSSESLRSLLAETPGVAASLASFISFLNASYELSIVFPKDNREAIKLRRKRFEQILKSLMSEAASGVDVLDRWPAAALGYFHGVARVSNKGMALASDPERNGLFVTLKGQEYWIPLPSTAQVD